MILKLHNTESGPVVEQDARCYKVPAAWDVLFNSDDLYERLTNGISGDRWSSCPIPGLDQLLPPIESQEVWAAGVTYLRSKTARMAEAEDARGSDFYDRVYDADRPELFLKATPHRVSGSGQLVRIRSDSSWSVPEPELGVAVNSRGRIIGYTIGNDVSSRDIEGENPLYLPQAKVYDRCCGLGPSMLIQYDPLPGETSIELTIERGGAVMFEDKIRLESMKRDPEELVEWLFHDNSFPSGCFLLTGTGIVPPDSFTLQSGDIVRIAIDPIGVLENSVVRGPTR